MCIYTVSACLYAVVRACLFSVESIIGTDGTNAHIVPVELTVAPTAVLSYLILFIKNILVFQNAGYLFY